MGIPWVKERYVKLDKHLSFEDLDLEVFIEGWEVENNSSALLLRFAYTGRAPLLLEVREAKAEVMNLTVEGEGGKATLQPHSEKEVAVLFPANGRFVEEVFLNITYRRPIGEDLAEGGYITLTIEMGGVELKGPTFVYIPKQCEEEPWDGDLVGYYSRRGVRILKVEREFIADVVCMACHICPKGYLWRVWAEGNTTALEEDGWKRE